MNIVKLQDIKLTHRNPLHSYALTMRKQKEIKDTIPFIIATKRIKYLGVYFFIQQIWRDSATDNITDKVDNISTIILFVLVFF